MCPSKWTSSPECPDQLRVNPKYWRRLEAEARVIAVSMGDPELNASCFTWPPGTSGLPSGPNCKTRSGMLTAHPMGRNPKVMGEAFDLAWSEIADNFGADRAEAETVRSKLANALLSVASEDSRNAHVLTRAALQRFALDYWRI